MLAAARQVVRLLGLASFLLLPLLAGCDSEEKPYVELVGGGFVFNYRIAEARYGTVAVAQRELPAGSRIVASFDNPAGGPPFVVEKPAVEGQLSYVVDSPPVKGVVAGRDYKVVVRLESPSGEVLETHEKSFHSDIDQSIMPDKPLVIGPGYTKNPETTQ